MIKVGGDDMETKTPFLPPEMLQHLLGFLPVASLRSCRLVNHEWKKAALVPMRQMAGPIAFRLQYESSMVSDHKYLESFLAFFEACGGDFPVSKFESTLSPRREESVEKLLETVSPMVTELGLSMNLGADRPRSWPQNHEYLKLSCLKIKINFNVGIPARLGSFTRDMFEFLEEAIIRRAPQLKTVSLEFGNHRHINRAEAHCLEVISERPVLFQKLTNLQLNMSDLLDTLNISKLTFIHGLKLKTLKVHGGRNWVRFCNNAVTNFLESQAESLVNLEIQQERERTTATLRIPALKNLERLKIAGEIRIDPLSSSDFPKLKSFYISGSPWNRVLKGMFKAEDPFHSVEELSVGKGDYEDPLTQEESIGILKAAQFFPNVSKLEVTPIYIQMAKTVYENFPNVVELSLTNSNNGFENMDQILTGVNGYKLQHLELTLKGRHNQAEELCRRKLEGNKYKSIASLQQLRALTIRTSESNAQLEFGLFTSFVLKSVNSLKCLDLGIRSFPKSDEHTDAVLQDLREKLSVTYCDPRKQTRLFN